MYFSSYIQIKPSLLQNGLTILIFTCQLTDNFLQKIKKKWKLNKYDQIDQTLNDKTFYVIKGSCVNLLNKILLNLF